MIQAHVIGAERVVERFGRISAGVRARMLQVMEKVANDIKRYVQETKLSGNPIHVRTGNLRRSIMGTVSEDSPTQISAVTTAAGSEAPYARGLEYGTQPHVITPRDKMALMFTVNGQTIFRKRVNHPGNPAFAFMRSSLTETAPTEIAYIREQMAVFMAES